MEMNRNLIYFNVLKAISLYNSAGIVSKYINEEPARSKYWYVQSSLEASGLDAWRRTVSILPEILRTIAVLT